MNSSPLSPSGSFLEFLASPWAVDDWRPHFGDRADLERELALLQRVFPPSWLDEALVAPFKESPAPFPHQLPYHLFTIGGRTRLLTCAAELLRYTVPAPPIEAKVPMRGRLQDSDLYPPALSELLVGMILRHVGDVTWQPEGPRHGADYRVDHADGVLVAEVKRLWTARRQDAVARGRVSQYLHTDPSHQGEVFTAADTQFNTREDGARLYRRVRYAARQLATSARNASFPSDRASSAPGVLFLDLDGNSLLGNLRDQIDSWMAFPWAQSIDLVLFFDHVGWNGMWDAVAEPASSRSGRAWTVLARTFGVCSKGHLHLRVRSPGDCTLPFL